MSSSAAAADDNDVDVDGGPAITGSKSFDSSDLNLNLNSNNCSNTVHISNLSTSIPNYEAVNDNGNDGNNEMAITLCLLDEVFVHVIYNLQIIIKTILATEL